jgi:hypothetical protein
MIYPRLYCLTDMTEAMGLKDERSRLPMPIMQALSAERLSRSGMYLLSSSEAVYVFVGSGCEPSVVQDVFGTDLANVQPEYVSYHMLTMLGFTPIATRLYSTLTLIGHTGGSAASHRGGAEPEGAQHCVRSARPEQALHAHLRYNGSVTHASSLCQPLGTWKGAGALIHFLFALWLLPVPSDWMLFMPADDASHLVVPTTDA